MSELEKLLERFGWTIAAAPFQDVVDRWEGAQIGLEWIALKGPVRVVAKDAAELTSYVYSVEERLSVTKGRLKPFEKIYPEGYSRPLPDEPLPITRDAPPPKRKRRKRVTSELLRCEFPDHFRGTVCAALVWNEPREKLIHAQTHYPSQEITQLAIDQMYAKPKGKPDDE